jgi:hypothetical protein
MGRIASAVILGVIGVSGSWLGQGLWKQSPQAMWVGVAVVSLLSAAAIATAPALSRVPALANPRRRR